MAFSTTYGNPASPATDAVAVTPADGTAVDFRALYIGGAGNVTITTPSGNVAFVGVPAGTFLPVNCTQVRATGTTATSIVGLK